jgi:putative hydrolase of the HAD superfamily
MIKNIIFDQGGIILNIDYKLTSAAFKKLGVENFDEFYTQNTQTPLFDLYETGKISSAEFRHGLKQQLNILHVSDEDFDHAWSAMLLDLPVLRLHFIRQLKQTYNVFLLSNANAIHMTRAAQIYERFTGHSSLERYFHKIYLSHLCGYRKPKPESFDLVLRENNLLPHETLFVDDSYQHIAGAEKLGMKTLYLPEKTIIEVLPHFLAQNFG